MEVIAMQPLVMKKEKYMTKLVAPDSHQKPEFNVHSPIGEYLFREKGYYAIECINGGKVFVLSNLVQFAF